MSINPIIIKEILNDIEYCFILDPNIDISQLLSKVDVYDNLTIGFFNEQKILLINIDEIIDLDQQAQFIGDILSNLPSSSKVIYFGISGALCDNVSIGNWFAVADQICFDSNVWRISNKYIRENSQLTNPYLYDIGIFGEFVNAGTLCGIPIRLVNAFFHPEWRLMSPVEQLAAKKMNGEVVSSNACVIALISQKLNLRFANFLCCVHKYSGRENFNPNKFDKEDYSFFSGQIILLLKSYFRLNNSESCDNEVMNKMIGLKD